MAEWETPSLGTGLMALHSHRAERLLDVVVEWIRQHPLAPLEDEVVIVQSHAVAEWLQMALAQRLGVCAATRVALPGRFFWRVARQVLGPRAVPATSPLDKLPLTWRLMQRLPAWLAEPDPPAPVPSGADAPGEPELWQPLRDFMSPDPEQRLWPLCERLADLYDQYQIYRPDWLSTWAGGGDTVTQASGRCMPLAPGQRWQARLWRRLVEDLTPDQRLIVRPVLMQRVLSQLEGEGPVHPLPRRVLAFGMSHLPPGLLALLGALSRHSQVMLAVPNPCQYHWADAIDGRDLLRSLHRRQRLKGGVDLSTLPLSALHAHAHPLLTAWGRQSRDFVRLLDEVDDTARGRGQAGWPRLDLFLDESDPEDTQPRSLLRQIQNAIRDLVPLADQLQQPGHGWTADDRSIVFHTAHSPVRELEVLHDQLLAVLGQGVSALAPRDVVVMVPDIGSWAPAIQAVFGQYERGDPRHIPFDIADLGAQALSPLVKAWAWLWRLPSERAGLSDWLALLEVPALQARFGWEADDVPRLSQWLTGAGLRWGLHADHRRQQGLPDVGDTHTARFAVDRMLWGYAVGEATPASDPFDPLTPPPAHPEPFADVAGLDAALAGGVAHLLDALSTWWRLCLEPASPATWVQRGRWLVQALFQADLDAEGPDDAAWPPLRSRLDPADRAAIDALLLAGERWLEASAEAGFDQPLSHTVAHHAWTQALNLPDDAAPFHAGGVTFCTLLPMRAIPFRRVCLLGMNEGDYPRRAPQSDLDLMAQPGMARPGDRLRRDDDRQLMLEALMSARDGLYVSWCGRSVRDNSVQPPSVLVAQLRDHIAQGWGMPVLNALTTEHPLQPFSPVYWQGDPHRFTHAHEWAVLHQPSTNLADEAVDPDALSGAGAPAPALDPGPSWSLRDLADALCQPVRVFCQRQLALSWDRPSDEVPDDEPFGLDGLLRHQLQRDWLDPWARAEAAALADPAIGTAPPADTAHAEARLWAHLNRQWASAQRAGRLPLGAPAAVSQADWLPVLGGIGLAWYRVQRAVPHPLPRRWWADLPPLADWLDGLFQPAPHTPEWAELTGVFPGLASARTVAVVRDGSRLASGRFTGSGPIQPPPAVWRPERLIPVWLRSLALSASASTPDDAHLIWVAADATVYLPPWPAADALDRLRQLVAHLTDVLRAPLPLPPRTAWAWVNAQAKTGGDVPPSVLAAVYEGTPNQVGERQTDVHAARFFPDLAQLLADGRFAERAAAIWAPLRDWAEAGVWARPHTDLTPPPADPPPQGNA